MLIRVCVRCTYHEVKKEKDKPVSYCAKENCWSRFSKCIAGKALTWFLEQESAEADRPFSALNFVYPPE